jgi:hypothetical protein
LPVVASMMTATYVVLVDGCVVVDPAQVSVAPQANPTQARRR